MPYTYCLKLGLATKSNCIDLCELEKSIKECAEAFNETCKNVSNPKSLTITEIDKKEIVCTLKSSTSLNSPGKALRFYSKILYEKESRILDDALSKTSGQLFRITQIGVPSIDDENPDIALKAAREISDADLIKGLIDFVCKKKDGTSAEYVKKNKAITAMKNLALSSGIITLEADNKSSND